MANRAKGYGMTADIDNKLRAKYSDEDEAEVKGWIEARTGLNMEGSGQDAFRDWLYDGVVLHELLKSFNLPGIGCYKFHDTSSSAKGPMRNMKESENIEGFLKDCEKMGMRRLDMFQTVNIRDNQNMAQVLTTLHALGTLANSKGVSGASIGTKYASKNERQFDEEKQRAGRNVIGLQMGTNQVASQKGMTQYGQGRQIVHKTN